MLQCKSSSCSFEFFSVEVLHFLNIWHLTQQPTSHIFISFFKKGFAIEVVHMHPSNWSFDIWYPTKKVCTYVVWTPRICIVNLEKSWIDTTIRETKGKMLKKPMYSFGNFGNLITYTQNSTETWNVSSHSSSMCRLKCSQKYVASKTLWIAWPHMILNKQNVDFWGKRNILNTFLIQLRHFV